MRDTVLRVGLKAVVVFALLGEPALVANKMPAPSAAPGAMAASPIAAVSVSPSSASLPPGGSIQFSVAVEGTGNPRVFWMAAGGTITDSGRFTAGTQPGVYQVTATLMQGRVASTAIVSISATGVEILPGQNIQSIVDASPQGTVFILKSGVHRRQTVRPKSGMSFIGETGTVMDGENVAAHAFETLASNPSNVTIRGLVITRYAPPSQFGAIQGDNGTNWLVEDNEISFNANHGLRPGPGMHIVNNFIHHNGVVGINGFRADNVIIEDNEVADNGTPRGCSK